MFGYVVPHKPELKVKELDFYKSIYCGVCKQVGKKYGRLMQMFLSYDIVFMALLLQSANKDEASITRGRCLYNPLKRELFCNSHSIHYSAGISVLMVYYKLLDDIKDSGFFKSLISRFIKLILSPSYNKAKRLFKEADESIKNSVMLLEKLEKQNCDNIDLAASTFYDMLAFIISNAVQEEKNKRIVYEMSKNIGRWIYILDAYNDIEDDVKENGYNPLVYRYKFSKENETVELFRGRIKDKVEFTLNQCLYNLKNAFEILEDDDSSVLKNIVYLGLPQKQHSIIYKKGSKENGSL